MSQFSEFCRHNPLCCSSTSVCCCCCLFRYRLSPETFGYTLVCLLKVMRKQPQYQFRSPPPRIMVVIPHPSSNFEFVWESYSPQRGVHDESTDGGKPGSYKFVYIDCKSKIHRKREHLCKQLSPWRRALLQKLIVAQLVKGFHTFHRTWMFITAFRRALRWPYP
jgi:hypothetical protein